MTRWQKEVVGAVLFCAGLLVLYGLAGTSDLDATRGAQTLSATKFIFYGGGGIGMILTGVKFYNSAKK